MRISVSSGRSKIQRLIIKRVQCLTFRLMHESHYLAHADFVFVTIYYANEFSWTICLVVITEQNYVLINYILVVINDVYIKQLAI